jgi:hypothetical protein
MHEQCAAVNKVIVIGLQGVVPDIVLADIEVRQVESKEESRIDVSSDDLARRTNPF